MKIQYRLFIILLALCITGLTTYAQNEEEAKIVTYKIIKQNGASFVGQIISRDAREILVQSDDVGLVYIPKHEIKEIMEVREGEKIMSGGLFATRYFLTTNGFAIKKGDNYVQWNIFGPDFQFGVADNFTVGIMTSWAGMPIIGTTKYSFKLDKKLYGGVGFLGGTGSWAFPKYGLLLPYGFLSVGDRVNNVNFSAGYGLLFSETKTVYTIVNQPTDYSTNSVTSEDMVETQGRALLSFAGMFRINNKFSFVFDSFIMMAGKDRSYQRSESTYNETTQKATYYLVNEVKESKPFIVLSPGLRFQATESSSFQFGFTGVHMDGEFVPVPIPMIQWFKRI